jgi:hypothetical protein
MLVIALEPEAAALFVKHLPVERRVDGKDGKGFQTFSPGSEYIVVDAGGTFYFNIGFICKEYHMFKVILHDMKLLRYQRVISLKTQVGIAN